MSGGNLVFQAVRFGGPPFFFFGGRLLNSPLGLVAGDQEMPWIGLEAERVLELDQRVNAWDLNALEQSPADLHPK